MIPHRESIRLGSVSYRPGLCIEQCGCFMPAMIWNHMTTSMRGPKKIRSRSSTSFVRSWGPRRDEHQSMLANLDAVLHDLNACTNRPEGKQRISLSECRCVSSIKRKTNPPRLSAQPHLLTALSALHSRTGRNGDGIQRQPWSGRDGSTEVSNSSLACLPGLRLAPASCGASTWAFYTPLLPCVVGIFGIYCRDTCRGQGLGTQQHNRAAPAEEPLPLGVYDCLRLTEPGCPFSLVGSTTGLQGCNNGLNGLLAFGVQEAVRFTSLAVLNS